MTTILDNEKIGMALKERAIGIAFNIYKKCKKEGRDVQELVDLAAERPMKEKVGASAASLLMFLEGDLEDVGKAVDVILGGKASDVLQHMADNSKNKDNAAAILRQLGGFKELLD